MRAILIILTLWFVCAVGCSEQPEVQKQNVQRHASMPKYHQGQIVFILGDVPGYIRDTPTLNSDNRYEYVLNTRMDNGGMTHDTWYEEQLMDVRYTGQYMVTRKDTVYREEIINIRTNTLTDQQQWVDAEVRNTREEFLTLEQLFSAEAQHGHNVSAEDVVRLLQKLHTIHDSDMKHFAGELKAGRYPRN